MTKFTRRDFLKTSAAAAAGLTFAARSWAQVTGVNGDVRVAVIGLNGRGNNHVQSLQGVKGVRIVALCDPDTAVLERAKRRHSFGPEVKTYVDIRKLFEAQDVDAVTIATPNHWHALATIWACQAGKDVYVEKPISHNVWEGRQVVAAAKKSNRVVQAGTQIRSGEGLREAVEWIRAGNLGKITAARGFCYKRRDSIGHVDAPPPVPSTVDLDLWSGPAPKEVPHRKKFHYDWHWQWPTGNGDVGNQGIHQMDVARWFLGESGLPRHTLSIGGRFGYVDDGTTPNTQVVWHDYASAPLIFEVRGLPARPGKGVDVDPNMNAADAADAQAATMDNYRGVAIGNVIDCEGGSLIIPNYFTAKALDKDGKVVKEFKGRDRHMQNFIDVVRSRKMEDLYGPVGEGHVSSALCHLGNISHQLGHDALAAETKELIGSKAGFAEAYDRMAQHLGKHKLDLTKSPVTLGLPLEVDAKAEKFLGATASKANPMLTRNYRAPFVVPQLA